MMFPFVDIPFTSINLYQQPISMRWGYRKLAELCRSYGRDPKINELFLFYNAKRNCLKLVWRDATGGQEISKAFPQGGALLPAPQLGQAFVQIERSKLNSLFRSA